MPGRGESNRGNDHTESVDEWCPIPPNGPHRFCPGGESELDESVGERREKADVVTDGGETIGPIERPP